MTALVVFIFLMADGIFVPWCISNDLLPIYLNVLGLFLVFGLLTFLFFWTIKLIKERF